MNVLQNHFDWTALNDARARRIQRSFHSQLLGIHRQHIPEGSRVLEWGCGAGSLLAGLKPSRGVGIDLSPEMIARAEAEVTESNCEFRTGDLHDLMVEEKFDYIVLNYLTGYLDDIQHCFQNLLQAAEPRTRLHISSLNTPWLFPLRLAEKVGAVMKQPVSNWLSRKDLENLLELSGWEVIEWRTEQLCPFEIPLISTLFNRFLVRLPWFRHYGITLKVVARPKRPPVMTRPVSCSVVVPARNEAGNIRAALERIPVLGQQTEIIFVEGNSSDDTWDVIQREMASYTGPHQVKALRQPGKGKWDAVRAGFAVASGDMFVVQDADLTAPPEALGKFFEAVASGTTEFANGSRLVYPMEAKAMRFLNFLGNHFFANALTFLLGQPIKDSLCGTKMMMRGDYERAMRRIEALGDFDPFGDFNLLFGAALLNLRIRDIPVRYKDRQYGATNISRFRHGLVLARMTIFGLRHIRFFPVSSRGTGMARREKKGSDLPVLEC